VACPEDNDPVRSPHASSVVVALSTFIAVATVSVVVSQLGPVDQVGAVLPVSPITVSGDPIDPTGTPTLHPGDAVGDQSPASDDDAATDAGEPETIGDDTIVVDPAPAVPVADPEPTTPAAPGNSGNAPGHGATNPASENSNGNGTGKP
jgi:hypothetical protein